MFNRKRLLFLVAVAVVPLVLGAGTKSKTPKGDGEGDAFDQARIFFEYNATDNDLGAQVVLDGEAWNRLKIIGPRGRVLDLKVTGELGELGLTELFWESDEPSPEEVLALLEAGEYEFQGATVEGGSLESESTLSHELPPAPNILEPTVPGEVLDRASAVIQWEAIPGIASLEVIVENEEAGKEMTVPLAADSTTLHVPVEFLDPNTEYKVEVLAIAGNGNKTISERVFVTGP